MREKNINKITVLVFLSLVFGFSLWNLFLPQKAFSDTENRSLSLFPRLDEQEIKNGHWMQEFEQYASDQFLLRDEFMRIKTKTDLALGKKDNGKVYFGKNGYLISMDDIDERQQAANAALLCSFLDRVSQMRTHTNKIRSSILIVPTASTIERDKLPDFSPDPEEGQRILNLKAQVEHVSRDTIFVNPMEALSSAKKDKKTAQLYYRNDHHWTTDGAYEAYRLWAEENSLQPFEREDYDIHLVTDQFYGTNQAKALGAETVPDQIYSWTLKSEPKYRVEIPEKNEERRSLYEERFLTQKDKYAYFLGGNFGEMIIHTPIKNDRSLLVIKDSYANCFIPFLAGHFEKITLIDPRYFRGSIEEVMQRQETTDLLFLYNVVQFCNDRNFVYGVR